ALEGYRGDQALQLVPGIQQQQCAVWLQHTPNILHLTRNGCPRSVHEAGYRHHCVKCSCRERQPAPVSLDTITNIAMEQLAVSQRNILAHQANVPSPCTNRFRKPAIAAAEIEYPSTIDKSWQERFGYHPFMPTMH